MKRVCTVLIAIVLLWSSATAATGSAEVPGNLAINTSALGDAWVGETYTAALSAVGGRQPYSWSLIEGSLPAGLGVNSAGVISGIPEGRTGVWYVTFRVTDADHHTAQISLSISVTAGQP